MESLKLGIDENRFYTANSTAKFIGCSIEEVRELLRYGKLTGDDGFGVYQRILGYSIIRHIEKNDHFQEEILESGKDGFSFYKNMSVENITKHFNFKIRRANNGYRKSKKWYSAYTSARSEDW